MKVIYKIVVDLVVCGAFPMGVLFMRHSVRGRFQGLATPRILMIVIYRLTKGFVFWFLSLI